MGMIGNPLVYSAAPAFNGTGNGSTTAFTLSWIPGSQNAVIAAVSGFLMKPGIDYTVNANTLTFTNAPAAAAPIVIYGLGVQGVINVPADGSVTSQKLASNLTLTGNTSVANIVGNTVSTGVLAMSSQFTNRNRFINGDFSVWQRGSTFTTTGYSADRWNGNITTSGATITRQAFVLGQTDVPNEPEAYLQAAVTTVAGAAAAVTLRQRIESVRSFAGQTVTLSFYLQAASTTPIAITTSQNFGTTGTPTATNQKYIGTVTPVDSLWHRYSLTFAVDSISGASLGTDGNDYFMVEFWLDAGSNFNTITNTLGQRSGTYKFSSMQIELGSQPTPFEVIGNGITMASCQRYYQKSFLYGTVPAQNAGTSGAQIVPARVNTTGTTYSSDIIFPVAMRAAPTLTTYNPSAASAQARDLVALVNATATVVASASTRSFIINYNGASTSAIGNPFAIHWTAESEL
jgi:hypothetical protein